MTVFRFSELIGVPVGELTGSSRFANAVTARQLYWKLLRERYGATLRYAGELTGRKHCTVYAGIRRVNGLLEQGDRMAVEMWGKVNQTGVMGWRFIKGNDENLRAVPDDRDFEVLFDDGTILNFSNEDFPVAEVIAWREIDER